MKQSKICRFVRKWSLSVGLAVALLCPVSSFGSWASASSAATSGSIAVEPTVGIANGSVVVMGQGFAPGTALSVANETTSLTICSTTAASDGTFACSGVAHGRPGITTIGIGGVTSKYRAIGSGYITTVAGSGLGDGGSSTNSFVSVGQAVATDKAGNVYFVDAGQNLVRRIDAVTGTISTIAGNRTAGYNGDGIPAIQAELNFPSGVAVDQHGNVFIADYSNARIREVHSGTHLITTVAGDGTTGYAGDGGPATAAELSPVGLAVDTHGNVFIADAGNGRVREVSAATKDITTVAGDGLGGFGGDGGPATGAELTSPNAVAVDASDNLYISDTGNQRIRRVDGTTGVITTIAGDGTAGRRGDGGPAIDAELTQPLGLSIDSADDVFIADSLNGLIRRVDAATGIITTVAGNGGFGDGGNGGPATKASLSVPFGVATDAQGDLFIAQQDAQSSTEKFNDVRRVDGTTKIITTLVTNDSPNEGGDGGPATQSRIQEAMGVAVDAAGDMFVSDDSNRIREIDGKTGVITTKLGNGRLSALDNPLGLALDRSGNLYVADSLNERVLRIDKTSGTVTTVAGTGTAGYTGDNGPATSAELNLPASVAVDAAGDIFIWDEQNNVIREVHAGSGTITTFSTTLSGGVATDKTGNLWVASGGGLYEVDLATNQTTSIPGVSGNGNEVAVDGPGNVFIAGQTSYLVQCYNPTNGSVTTVAGTGHNGYSGDGGLATDANLYQPMGIAADGAGDVLVATYYDGRVREVHTAQCG